jgi:CRP-like cAMP-binding protein
MIIPPNLPYQGDNKLLASISLCSDELHLFELSLSRTRLATGALILDKDIDHVLFIEKGIVSPTVISADGNSLGIAIIGNEGAVGLHGIGAGAYSLQARALTEVEAMQISTRALDLACSRSRELESLLRHHSDLFIRDSIVMMACHYHHDLDERLPQWLLAVTERAGSNKLSITLEILAEAHGVTPSAVSPVLEGMERKGLIQRARGQITVLNRRRLNSIACRCYPAIDREKKYIIKTRSL